MRTLATFTVEDPWGELPVFAWHVVEYDFGDQRLGFFVEKWNVEDDAPTMERYGFSTLAKAMAYALLRSGWYLDDLTEAFEAISGCDS